MVSTDDTEIADVALKFGATVPFLRSPQNSNDTAGTLQVLQEVITDYKKLGKTFDELCCIYPVSPLIDVESLRGASQLLEKDGVDFVIPVCRYSTPIQRALKIQDDKLLMADPTYFKTRSQDLEPRFFDVGQFYFANCKSLFEVETFFNSRTAAFEISEFKAQDVDNEIDWKILEFKYSHQNNF